MKNILVTGAAGFIGFHLSKCLVEQGFQVTGVDNLNDYYSVKLKESRLDILNSFENFRFQKINIAEDASLKIVFEQSAFDVVYHLAAQAGVRYSIEHPQAYVESNLVGFANILECCRNYNIQHLIYASSSSIYGLNTKQPYSEHTGTAHPVSLYAATKKSNELMAHVYAHLYQVPVTGLRFFTVYGPWGRPDMAYYKFVNKIMNNEEIDIYNKGEMSRDFTYIDDIVEALVRLRDKVPAAALKWNSEFPDPAESCAPFRIYNIGNNAPVHLMEFIKVIQQELNKKAKMNFLPMQPGDVQKTWADSSELYNAISYKPCTPIQEGIRRFVQWHKQYHRQSESVMTA